MHKKKRLKTSAVAEADCLTLYNFVTNEDQDIIDGVIYLKSIDNGAKVVYIDSNGKFLVKEMFEYKKSASGVLLDNSEGGAPTFKIAAAILANKKKIS